QHHLEDAPNTKGNPDVCVDNAFWTVSFSLSANKSLRALKVAASGNQSVTQREIADLFHSLSQREVLEEQYPVS
ncbi:hypothetical protein AVEN_106840-1, partial [Araneus ventricosus]